MSHSRLWMFVGAVCVCLVFFAGQLSGAESDLREDIIYSSEGGGSIETVDGIEITTLRTNVRVRQGLTEIFGDTATVRRNPDTGELIRVTVAGSPARFIRQTPDDTQAITGYSTTINYYNETGVNQGEQLSVVEFVGDANFNRGRTALQCSEIKHVVETGATDSPGPCSGVLAPATN